MNSFHKLWVPGLLAVAVVCAAAAQEKKVELKKEAAPVTSASSGQEMFTSYCAACHGTDGKGSGPAAAALKTAPADLTTLTRRNNGKYPEARVSSVLNGQRTLVSHGDQEMPVWGPVFRKISGGDAGQVQMRVANLNRYLESIQVK